jgi:hypothetical protein
MQCFFQLLEAFFQKWTFIFVHFQKIVKTFEKNDSLHSFSIRLPIFAGLPLCYRLSVRRWSRATHYAVLFKMVKNIQMILKMGRWIFYKRWGIVFSTSFIIIGGIRLNPLCSISPNTYPPSPKKSINHFSKIFSGELIFYFLE